MAAAKEAAVGGGGIDAMVMDGEGAAEDAVSDARSSGAEQGTGCRFCLQPCACFATVAPCRLQYVQASLDRAKHGCVQTWNLGKRPVAEAAARLCVFITAVPNTKLFAWGDEDSGGHVLRETTSRGLCGLVCPSRTSERGRKGDCVKEGGGEEGERVKERVLGVRVRHSP
jgi:hypothetical protein